MHNLEIAVITGFAVVYAILIAAVFLVAEFDEVDEADVIS
jgi:hypothetical protein